MSPICSDGREGGEADAYDQSSDKESGDEDDDDDDRPVISVTSSLASATLSAADQPKGLQSRTQGIGARLAQPQPRHTIHLGDNPTAFPPPPSIYQLSSNAPVYLQPPAQSSLSSRLSPQFSTHAQSRDQQPPSLDSTRTYAIAHGLEQSSFPTNNPGLVQPQGEGYTIDRSHDRYWRPPPQQSSPYDSPYALAPAQGSGNRSGYGQAQGFAATTRPQNYYPDPSASFLSGRSRSKSPDPATQDREKEKEQSRRKKPNEGQRKRPEDIRREKDGKGRDARVNRRLRE